MNAVCSIWHHRRPMRSLLVLLAILSTISGCGLLGFESWSWNQRLIVEVSTPNGVVTGSSVSFVSVGRAPDWIDGSMGASLEAGEATAVEVAPGKYLFALLKEHVEDLAFYTFYPRNDHDSRRQATEIEKLRARGDVPSDRYPILVTFRDRNDPRTIRQVNPGDLASTFGPGFSLVGMKLEITDDPVTQGPIRLLLPWLDWSSERFLAVGGGQSPLRLPREIIGRASFFRGET